jgi:hypothetical protein
MALENATMVPSGEIAGATSTYEPVVSCRGDADAVHGSMVQRCIDGPIASRFELKMI